MAIKARELGFKGMIVPESNATEAAVVNNLKVYGLHSLREVVDFLSGTLDIEPPAAGIPPPSAPGQAVSLPVPCPGTRPQCG